MQNIHHRWPKGIQKCCISNAVDKTDDDTLWNGSEDEGIECEDGDNDTDWWR